MAGGVTGVGDEIAWLHLRQAGQCGRVGAYHFVSGRDTALPADTPARISMPVRWCASSLAIRKRSWEHDDIMPVVMACISMGKQKVGALIVVEHNLPLDDVVRTGEIINADINQRLIENIFFKNSPLHDGAMVISKKRIKAAGCILPVSHNLDIPKELGLRHRAAMGISQVSDAHAIIVSEETGGISVAYKGQFYLRLNAEELESLLTKES